MSKSNDPRADLLLTPRQAADQLQMSEGTLNVWRCTKRYDLPYVKVGRSVRYRPADIAQFIEARTVAAGA